ncbi:hypothetical protein RM531_09075 [Salinisphaera sp. P385]|uniref:Uncharacterized protein n=1 Tax=Spectribacter acetivorans TaxID=3075603 RepID=A0ABU3BCC7_9GAMM|nr:hypothetical protein [Salinisphaera sp. P385]MDT0618631.1 hypothetical protein [Salinisphaera sp. P385]
MSTLYDLLNDKGLEAAVMVRACAAAGLRRDLNDDAMQEMRLALFKIARRPDKTIAEDVAYAKRICRNVGITFRAGMQGPCCIPERQFLLGDVVIEAVQLEDDEFLHSEEHSMEEVIERSELQSASVWSLLLSCDETREQVENAVGHLGYRQTSQTAIDILNGESLALCAARDGIDRSFGLKRIERIKQKLDRAAA